MRIWTRTIALAVAASAAAVSPAWAKDGTAADRQPSASAPAPADVAGPDDIDADANSLTIGAGGAIIPSYEGSNDYVVIPVGALRGKVAGFSFFSRGTELYVDAVRDHGPIDIQFGPAIAVNFNRTSRIVDPQVRALGRRKTAFEVGGFAAVSKTGVITSAYDSITVRLTYLRDVSGIHDSFVLTPSIEYGTPLSKRAYVGISAAASIAGDRYAQSYFAVDAAGAAASGLPVFARPRGGFKDFTISTLASYSLSGDLRRGFALFALGSYGRLQGDFADSPVTSVAGSATQLFGALGIGYTF